MSELIEFETERLSLRQWRDADKAPLAAINADPRVMQFFPARLEHAQSDALFGELQNHIDYNGFGIWAVEEKATGTLIGAIGIQIPAPDLPVFPCVEIAWRLAANQWGKGFATEAARGALHVGFDQLGLPEIVSFTPMTNLRSRELMKRLGMRDTGQTFEHPNVPEGHSLRKHCLYFLSRKQWQAANPAPVV
ncbi:MAG: GNAT family N-acetyltransferase [Steroidobacteraceae bacterium]